MTKKEICEQWKTFAYYSGLGGLEAKYISCGINDYLYVVAGAWNGKPTYHKLRIYNDTKGGYIRLHGYKCCFSDFIRMETT